MEVPMDRESSSSEEDSSEEESSSSSEEEEDQQQPPQEQQPLGVAAPGGEHSSSSESEDEGRPGQLDQRPNEEPSADSGAFPNTQDLFGGDSSSESSSGSEEDGRGTPDGGSETPIGGSGTPEAPMGSPLEEEEEEERDENRLEVARESEDEPSQTVEGIFGDAADVSSSDEEGMETGAGGDVVMGREGTPPVIGAEEGEPPVSEEEVPRINVEIPRCVAPLGSELHFVKLPNFLSVETRPFDSELYEDEGDDDDVLDEEGRARLKLKVENTIRWRYSQDESGNDIRESNARIVKWTDGSMSLYLGGEIFDIYRQSLQGEYSHLFVRQGTGLQGQGVFRTKLSFRPHSTDSHTHRKMTLSIADRFSKAQKIRVLPAVGKDPESQRTEKIKKEEDNLRQAIRREHQKRRVRERHLQKGGLTASYLEPDRELDYEEDIGAIKSSVRSRFAHGGGGGGGVSGESDVGSSDEEEAAHARLLRAKAVPSEGTVVEQGLSGRKRKSRKLMLSDDEDSD